MLKLKEAYVGPSRLYSRRDDGGSVDGGVLGGGGLGVLVVVAVVVVVGRALFAGATCK